MIDEGSVYVDRGIWANNPSMVAIVEALRIRECNAFSLDRRQNARTTHFQTLRPHGSDWETGALRNHITEIEHIRDYSFRVVFGNWAVLKNHSKFKAEFARQPTTWTIDLHYPKQPRCACEAFRSEARHIKIQPYPIPCRCLYSRNIENLLMAGRNISVTHVALGTVRVQRTTGMMGEVLGMAASLCTQYGTTPRGVYQNHLAELQRLMQRGVGKLAFAP